MKFYHALFLSLVSLSLPVNASRDLSPPPKTPLMVSHLPPQLLKSVHLNNNLSYATGHTFYDTPIELSDDTGQTIHFKEDLNLQGNYKITSLGQTTETHSMIWFFSPEGSAQIYYEGADVCTAENPCKELTQNLVDGISHWEEDQNLWFATGSYELPMVQQRFSQANLIEFYKKQHVFGRTPDFRHIAYKEDRPLFTGTLSWNDYTGHEGSRNFVENIQVNTHSNYAEVENYYVDTNLHSAGRLIIANCALEKFGESGNQNNVIAKKVWISRSDLNTESEFLGANIEANEIELMEANLKMKSRLGSNIISQNGILSIYHSTLSLHANGCRGTAIDLKEMEYVGIAYSKIIAKTEDECIRDDILSGIEDNRYYQTKVRLADSEINVFSKYGNGYAFIGLQGIKLDGATLSVQSPQGKAGITNHTGEVIFLNHPSNLSITSPEPGRFFENVHQVLNQSSPPSLCRTNNNDVEECSIH